MSNAALRMACVWLLHDSHGRLTLAQRDWLTTRLATPTPLTFQEITRLAPTLVAWGTAREARLGEIIARCSRGAPLPLPTATSGLAVLQAYPGPAGDGDTSPSTATPTTTLSPA
jgi:hypothetical protein